MYRKNTTNKINDWDIDLTEETIIPSYDPEKKNYHLTMDKLIDGLNNSKYPINGENVWLPDEDGILIPLPDWIEANGGGGGGSGGGGGGDGGGGVIPQKTYRLEMSSSHGTIIKDKNYKTVLKATLYEDNKDVTAIKNPKYFKWARVSGASEQDQIADAQWNLKWSAGAKEIPITNEDVNLNAMFQVQFVTESESKVWETEALKTYINKLTNRRN